MITIQAKEDIAHLGLKASIAFCRAMSKDQLQEKDVVAVVAALVDPLLNIVVATKAQEANIEEAIAAVFDFYRQHNVDWYWLIGPLSQPKTLSHHLERHGLTLLEEAPSLYFDLTQTLPAITASQFKIEEAGPSDHLQEWAKTLCESFPSSDKAESYRLLNAGIPHGPGSSFRHYVGYYQNLVVSAGTLFIYEDSVMIHNIATKPNFRHRGFGTAITLYAMQEAKRLGKKHCFLDSSPKGLHLYENIGFKIYCHYQLYGKPEEKI